MEGKHNLLIYIIIGLFIALNPSFGQVDSSIISNTTDSLLIDSSLISSDSLGNISEAHSMFVVEEGPSFYEKLTNDKGLPVTTIILLIIAFVYMAFKSLALGMQKLIDDEGSLSKGELYDIKENKSSYAATSNTAKLLIPVVALLYLLYIAVAGTYMQGYVTEWLNLLVRWAHVVAGIMWIGASFYFVFLENNLNRTKNIREELAGNLWAVHGGGFYFLEKYKVAPKVIPKDLHWFKYEAYFTFLTGFALLIVVYYLDANAFLIDKSIADISIALGITIGVCSIAVGWIVYDLMCKSRLVEKPLLFALIGFLLLTGMAYFLTEVFNPRAAFIHIGAIIGAIMVGNVYFNIIPAQKQMVKSAIIGEPLDASLGKVAGQRSYHNNYFTLPVIFIMISNHFPSTFGHEWNWLVLAVISLSSAGIKHYWNLLDKGNAQPRILILSLVGLFGLAFVISPAFEAKMDLAVPVSFDEVNEIMQTRCVQCHSANPTDDVWKVAPNGVMYDTPQQIQAMSGKIMTRAVRSKNMPQGNKTNMTDEERKVLKRWILQGSKIDQ